MIDMTKYDYPQVLKSAYDETQQALKTTIANAQISISQGEDSIQATPFRSSVGDISGYTSATPSQSTQLAPANAARKYFILQNLSSTDAIYINFGLPASTAPGSFKIYPAGSMSFESSFITIQTINVMAQVASVPFTAKEG